MFWTIYMHVQHFMSYSFCKLFFKLAKLPHAPLNQRKQKKLVIYDVNMPHYKQPYWISFLAFCCRNNLCKPLISIFKLSIFFSQEMSSTKSLVDSWCARHLSWPGSMLRCLGQYIRIHCLGGDMCWGNCGRPWSFIIFWFTPLSHLQAFFLKHTPIICWSVFTLTKYF